MATFEIVGDESLRSEIMDRIRYFNRAYLNPFSLSFAGRPNSFWSVIQHRGRRSGEAYTTPVIAARQNGCFVIPLPYGYQVDWLRNVMAASGCDLIHRGKVYRAAVPEIVPIEAGLAAFPGLTQYLLRRSDTEAFLRLNQVEEAPDGDARYGAFMLENPTSRGLWVLVTIVFLIIGVGRLVTRRK
jgi:deazaflavin-dependent oxidoreductase (nitroreductase family)